MPQRFLRPGIRTSERWNAVSRNAQALYIAILTLVDDYGRYDGRPSVLWADAFAVWNEIQPQESAVNPQETAALCWQLADKKLVILYEVDGKRYLQVCKWEERARGKSRWPSPSDGKILRNPAESCGILPPSPSPSPSPPPSPSSIVGQQKSPVEEQKPLELEIEEAPKKEEPPKRDLKAEAYDAIAHLNETSGRYYRNTDANAMFIMARLSEGGVTLDGVKTMITRQWKRWRGTTMEEYIRPTTLFNKTKFDGYYASKDQPIHENSQVNSKPNPRNAGVVGDLAEIARKTAEVVARRQQEREGNNEPL